MMKKAIFIPISPIGNPTILLFQIFLFLRIINYYLFEKCNNRNNPFLLNNNCVDSCEMGDICTIDNEIIKTQYLNNIIYFKNESLIFFSIEVSENNNLYYIVSDFPQSNVREFYMLDNEGYGLFNKNNPNYRIEINDPANSGRFEADIFTFHLQSNTDNKEYLISISKSDQLMEIYDFYLNKIYFKRTMDVFDTVNIFHLVGAHIKLKKNANTYIIGICASEFVDSVKYDYFYLQKGNFNSLNIANNIPIFNSQKAECSEAAIISCYETSSNFIVCFYQNKEFKYKMIVYDSDLREKTNTVIAECISNDILLFFKCIHFFENTGVFGYFNNDENPIIIFKFKKYINENNKINDHYNSISELSINDIYFNHESVIASDMIKIEDKKFYFVGISLNHEVLYIVSIYNFYNEKFVKRIYSINIKNLNNYYVLHSIKLGIYKNFLVLGSRNELNQYPSLIIFSYPNTTEAYLDLIEYLYKNDDFKIYNLTLKLEGEYIMENNIFGYIYSGIQIIENCDDENIYLADSNNERIDDFFLPKNEEIKLIIPKNGIYSPFNCELKYASVFTEPVFLEYNNYPIIITYIGGDENEEQSFFESQRKNYIGKVNNFNLKLTKELDEENCNDNCELCESNNKDNCVTCKYESNIENNIKICKNNLINNSDELTNQNDNSDELTNQNDNSDELTNQKDISDESTNQKDNSDELTNQNKNSDEITNQNDNSDELTNQNKNSDQLTLDFLKNLCKINITNNNNNNKDNIIKNITNDIENRLLYSLISNVIGGEKKDVIINDNETIYQITSTENQKNNKNNKNISTVILGECEKILKDKYKINENQPLIIFKIDYFKEDSLIPIIGYEVFHPENKSKLDLKYCKDEIVNFSIPVLIDEDNFFKYDPNNEYYTDQCNPYTTENGTDILLNDRQNEYNENNMALCENNCELNSYDSDTKQVICDCKVKYKQIFVSEIKNQTDILYYNFTDEDESSNMNTMKCYYTLFTKEGFLTNIANYILLFTIILFMISIFIFFKFGLHLLENDIEDIINLRNDKIKKYINIKKSNNIHIKEKVNKAIDLQKLKNKNLYINNNNKKSNTNINKKNNTNNNRKSKTNINKKSNTNIYKKKKYKQ